MFQGMTLGEQRTLMALAVVIATGLGVQNYRDSQQHGRITIEHAAAQKAEPPAPLASPAPTPQFIPQQIAALPPPQNLFVPAPQPSPAAVQQGTSGKIDLNRATLAELDTLPGIGPVRAQAILNFRNQSGGFRTVEDLLAVDGIGEKTLEKLRPLVTVGN